MSKWNKYMMVHHNPGIDCEEVQANWRKLAQVEETVPDLWGEKWNGHLQKDAIADNLGN